MVDKSENIRSFEIMWDHWKELRRDGNLPSKQDISPRKLVSILPEVAIYELNKRHDVIVRLSGTAVEMRWPEHRQGDNMQIPLSRSQRKVMSDQLIHMLEMPCGCRKRYRHRFTNGSEAIISSLYLPMKDANSPWRHYVIAVHHMEGVLGMRASLPEMLSVEEIDHMFFSLNGNAPASGMQNIDSILKSA